MKRMGYPTNNDQRCRLPVQYVSQSRKALCRMTEVGDEISGRGLCDTKVVIGEIEVIVIY